MSHGKFVTTLIERLSRDPELADRPELTAKLAHIAIEIFHEAIDITGSPGDVRFECPVCHWSVTLNSRAAEVWTNYGAVKPRCNADDVELTRRVME